MHLTETPVLLLDIQATAAASAGGSVFELGWCRYPVPEATRHIHTHLAETSAIEFPPRLMRLTGLTPEDLQSGRPLLEIRDRLFTAAGAVASAGAKEETVSCPVVVHYARFEAPYLCQLQRNGHAPAGLCLDLICTHEITRRLLPGLPRKGLRAVAGYFGHDTPSFRRCAHHLAATGVIWSGLTKQLAANHGIKTLAELQAWLASTPVPSRINGKGGRVFQVPRKSLNRLPVGPGVYRLLSQGGRPLYVGKAKRLDQRVRTYFQPRRRHAEHILEMLTRAAQVKTTPTCTTIEAALLEQDLIKHLAPAYNMALRSDGSSLQFWSRDLGNRTPRWSPQTPLGPLPTGTPVGLLAPLMRVLVSQDQISDGDLLQIASADPLLKGIDSPLILEGLRHFKKGHVVNIDPLPPDRALQVIGRHIWRTRYIDPDPEDRDDTAIPQAQSMPAQTGAEDDPPWTTGRVSRLLEHHVCHTAALLRRSRWLTRLGNATLSWQVGGEAAGCRYLVLQRGRVVARGNHCDLATRPTPDRLAPSSSWRPQDRVTYDRLRVLTTELRRLVQEKRRFSIWLSADACLNRAHLARILPWF
jgi:DNA polymerase III epsilon subunit-like protein